MFPRWRWLVGVTVFLICGPHGAGEEKAKTEQIPAPKRNVYRLDRNDESSFVRVAFSPDDKWLAAVTDRGQLRIWDIARGHELGDIEIDLKHYGCRSLAFSPDSKRLAATFMAGALKEPGFLVCLWDLS